MSLDHNSPADFSPKSLYNQCLQSLGFVIKIRYDRTVPTFEVHIHWIILFTSISVSLSVKNCQMVLNTSQTDAEEMESKGQPVMVGKLHVAGTNKTETTSAAATEITRGK